MILHTHTHTQDVAPFCFQHCAAILTEVGVRGTFTFHHTHHITRQAATAIVSIAPDPPLL